MGKESQNFQINNLLKQWGKRSKLPLEILYEIIEILPVEITMQSTNEKTTVRWFLPKESRILFSVTFIEKTVKVQAFLHNLHSYCGFVQTLPVTIKNSIKNSRRCTKCNPQCVNKAIKGIIDNHPYTFCIVNGFVFENLKPQDIFVIKELVVEEALHCK